MTLCLKNGYILDFNEERFIKKDVLIENNRIIDINDSLSGDQNIDLENQYIIPGLINMHVHLFGSGKPSKMLQGGPLQKFVIDVTKTKFGKIILRKMVYGNAMKALNSGVTTIRAVGDFHYSDVEVRDMINDEKIGPRLFVSGPAITCSKGHGAGTFAIVGDTLDELEECVSMNASKNVDLIKICVTGGVMDAKKKGEPGECKMTLEQTKKVCEVAHKLGYKVASHTESTLGIKIALEGHVDTIEHGAIINEEEIKLFKNNKSSLICTLSPALPLAKLSSEITKLDEMCTYNANVVFEQMISGVSTALANNIKVGLGTDASCPFVTQDNMANELILFKKYLNISNYFALKTATKINSEILENDNIGSIEIGKFADLVILNKNPLDDLHVLKKPSKVMVNGNLINVKLNRNKYIEDTLSDLINS